jgi:peptidyl-prolyl cis-trans isomerase SurA
MFFPFSRPLSQLKLMIVLGMALALPAAPTPLAAQNLFLAVAYVNADAITNYELQQRIRLLEVLRTPGDLKKEAMKRLINERLQRQAGDLLGIAPTGDEVKAGIAEFATRLQLSGDEFLTKISGEGVAPESFRAFVRAGLAWRSLVRQRFAGKVAITDAEIDREIALASSRGSARVQISEIFLPTNTPQNKEISLQLAPKIAALRSIDDFAAAARKYSAGATRDSGGRVEKWVPLENLPALVRPVLLTMRPGQVTEPIQIPNALALFQLRAIQETTAPPLLKPTLDYASYLIAGGRSPAALARAAQVRASVDTCDDLYGLARNQPPEVLERAKLALADIPRDVALELAKLDPGDSSDALTRDNGQTLVFLMLCARSDAAAEQPSRADVKRQLTNQRLAALAEAYLDQLRANAAIVYP